MTSQKYSVEGYYLLKGKKEILKGEIHINEHGIFENQISDSKTSNSLDSIDGKLELKTLEDTNSQYFLDTPTKKVLTFTKRKASGNLEEHEIYILDSPKRMFSKGFSGKYTGIWTIPLNSEEILDLYHNVDAKLREINSGKYYAKGYVELKLRKQK